MQFGAGGVVQCKWKKYPDGIRLVEMGKYESQIAEQIIKADRLRGGLIPPFCG